MIEEKRNELVNTLRGSILVEQYYELIHYGKPIIDIEKTDIDGNFLRIFVFNYYGAKWFMHLENGEIIKIQEL